MDPKVDIYLNGKRIFESRVAEEAGKDPVWNQKFAFKIGNLNDTIKISTHDSDTFGWEHIGSTELKVKDFCPVGHHKKAQHSVYNNHKKSGNIDFVTTR